MATPGLILESTCINNLSFSQDSITTGWFLGICFLSHFLAEAEWKNLWVMISVSIIPFRRRGLLDSHWHNGYGRCLSFSASWRPTVSVLTSCQNLWAVCKMASWRETSKFAWKPTRWLELLNCSLRGCYKLNWKINWSYNFQYLRMWS